MGPSRPLALSASRLGGRIGIWLPVPQNPAMLGMPFYHQAVILDPLVTGVTFPIVTTHGISTIFTL